MATEKSDKACDIYGRPFQLAVDAEHKATELRICNFSNPHMRAFHTSWFGFFSSFFSTFAAAPLMPYIQKPTSLNLTKAEKSLSGLMSVLFTIFFRLAMGVICDVFGARKGLSVLLILTSPAILGMFAVQDAAGFITCRAIIGCGLATFVACQTWCSQQFNKKVVGIANATAAGWGNLGGGVTQLCMPAIFIGMLASTNQADAPSVREDAAWRLCYIVPFIMHMVGGTLTLTARDLPDGNFKELETSGAKQKSDPMIVVKTGFSNINAWLLTITYGMCFGIELTMNSIAAGYFYEYHGLSPLQSGLFASFFGLMNICCRTIGGWLSDQANAKFGVRGRLWVCWTVQTLEGFVCVIMGVLTMAMSSPYENLGNKITGHTLIGNTWKPMPSWSEGAMIDKCDSLIVVTSAELRAELGTDQAQVMVLTPPDDFVPGGSDCISNQNMAGAALAVMICFSALVQAAEGLHYGIVPYVSRPALGVVSGMVGAGGNAGCVVSLRIFFFGAFRTDVGIFNLGWFIIGLTSLMFFVYLPEHGSMFTRAGALGSYDPQIIKPPADYRGADQMDYAAAGVTAGVEIKKDTAAATAAEHA